MRYIFPLLLSLSVLLGGCEKNRENEREISGQSEYTSSAYSSNTELGEYRATEIVSDTHNGFGEIYIID